RTGVQGFAVLCVTTPPSGQRREESRLSATFRRGSSPRGCGAKRMWSLAVQRAMLTAAGLSMNSSWRGASLPIRASLELQVCYWHITAAMTVHAPIPDFAAARAAMVDGQLRPEGVTD